MLKLFALLALAGCKAESENSAVRAQYQAEVIRTEYGVAHISADSYGGLGCGEAYAAAEDHVCNMALALAQSRGESAAALAWTRPARAQRAILWSRRSRFLAERGRPSQSKVQTFVSGCRATPLATTILAANPNGVGSWCDTADWVRAATAEEFMAQYLAAADLAPSGSGHYRCCAASPASSSTIRTGSDRSLTGCNA